MNETDLETPCFIVDYDKIMKNCEKMRQTADSAKVNLLEK
jgi:D-serine deaminase-like pyridoxal phosphate-dependent protein